MGLVTYYLYCGDECALDLAREIADWDLKYLLPDGWAAGGLPLSHFDYLALGADGSYDPNRSLDAHTKKGFEPDKSAYTGEALMQLYGVTGEERYLDAGALVTRLMALQLESP